MKSIFCIRPLLRDILRVLCSVQLLVGVGLVHSFGEASASAEAKPVFPLFTAERCCDLCDDAADPAVYESDELRGYRMLVQGQDEWLFRTERDLPTTFGPDETGLRGLAELYRMLEAKGVTLVLVPTPTRGLMHSSKLPNSVASSYDVDVAWAAYSAALQRMRDEGLVVPELEKLLKAPVAEDFFFRGHRHWTPSGARRTAQIVADTVRRLPTYQRVPKTSFQTFKSGLLSETGSLKHAANRICGFGATKQYVTAYTTVPEQGVPDSEIAPQSSQVVVVGTGNTALEYNFSGFLSEYLRTPVFSVPSTSESWDQPLISYLAGEAFQRDPPAILIWEVSADHNLSKMTFYGRVLARMQGGCDGTTPVLGADLSLHAGRNEMLFVGGGKVKEVKSDDHLVDLQFSGIDIDMVEGTVWYVNGSRRNFRINALSPEFSDGRFMLRLADKDALAPLFLSLDINLPETVPASAHLKARLCEIVHGSGGA